MHILDLFLGGVETHTSHHVCNGFQWDLAIQFSCFCGMFIFRSDLTVIEEILKITHNLASGPTLQQLRERIFIEVIIETFRKRREINFPHIDTQIIRPRSEEKLPVYRTANTGNLGGMGNETHCIIGVTFEGQFYDPDYFVLGCVGEVFVLVVVFLVRWVKD